MDLMTDWGLMKGYDEEVADMESERDRLQADATSGKIGIDELAKKITKLNERINRYGKQADGFDTDDHWELSGRISEIGQLESELKELQGQEQKDLEVEIAGLKREVIKMSRGK